MKARIIIRVLGIKITLGENDIRRGLHWAYPRITAVQVEAVIELIRTFDVPKGVQAGG